MLFDAWMQHPTLRFITNPMFSSLIRWMGEQVPTEEIPIEMTLAAMDDAGIEMATLSAWNSPRHGEMISNDEVAAWVEAHPERFVGLASVDLDRPMEAVRELLDLGCDVNVENARGSTPLHFAAAAKDRARETCEVLMGAGADTGLSDLQGKLPYEVAESDELR